MPCQKPVSRTNSEATYVRTVDGFKETAAFSFISSVRFPLSLPLSRSLVYSPFCFCTHERSVNGSDVYVPLDRSAHVRQLRDGFLPTNGSTLRCERRRKKRLSSSLRKNGVDPSGEAVFSHMHETHASETPLSIQHSCLSMSE